MNVTKSDLCSKVSKKTGIQASDAKLMFDAFLDEIFSVLSEGKRIELRGFGAFKVREKRERLGRNPRTGDAVTIPPHKVPAFKFSKDGLKIFGEKLLNKPPAEPRTKVDVVKPKAEPEAFDPDRFKI